MLNFGNQFIRRAAFTAAVIGSAAFATPVLAAPITFEVHLTGAQEVPAVQTSGTGTADITYDATNRTVTWSIKYSGLSGPVTMAHFHGPAAVGTNGPVTLWLTAHMGTVANPIQGSAVLTADQAQQFLAGQWYVNLHTQSHPAGEVRGQVTPPKS